MLGTPKRNVYFTSWLDESIGYDTHLPTTTPSQGDWGGIIFRSDVDGAGPSESGRRSHLPELRQHADIRYGGGGNVVIDSIQQVVNPIQIMGMRPTISRNRVTRSADSAMSVTPDSFVETNFHSPRYQKAGRFTSDYERVGPDIHANVILNNSTNGLFIRIETPAATSALADRSGPVR